MYKWVIISNYWVKISTDSKLVEVCTGVIWYSSIVPAVSMVRVHFLQLMQQKHLDIKFLVLKLLLIRYIIHITVDSTPTATTTKKSIVSSRIISEIFCKCLPFYIIWWHMWSRIRQPFRSTWYHSRCSHCSF